MSETWPLDVPLRRVQIAGILVAIVAGVACIFGYATLQASFFQAYLSAYFFWLNITLGCMALAMLHGLTGGGWGNAIRRIVEAGYATLPLMALAFAPIWLNPAFIYPWADESYVQSHEHVARKAAYLNLDFFLGRAIGYFVIWLAIVFLLAISSPNADSEPDSPRLRRLQVVSGVGMIVYLLSLTLASVDWVMSLEPEWYSTMYGVLYLANQGLSGLAFAILVVCLLLRYEPYRRLATEERRHDLGNLLLAFVLFWAYVNFMQFLIIWSGNLPEENSWYLRRAAFGREYVIIALAVFHFSLPLVLLLWKYQKQHVATLARIAGLILIMQGIDNHWLIVPGFDENPATLGFGTQVGWEMISWAGLGGIWIATFSWRLAARSRVPIEHVREEEAPSYG